MGLFGPIRRRWQRFWWPTVSPGEFAGADTVAVIEWLTSAGGAEKVAAALVDVSDATAVCCLSERAEVTERLGISVPVHQSRVGSWAAEGRRWQYLLPIAPLLWGALDLSGASNVVTSSHSLVNSVPAVGHRVCYCHTPVRYGWDWRMETERVPRWLRPLFPVGAAALRAWDRHVAKRVDVFVANSTFVADRIARAYDRTAVVVHPVIDTDWFVPNPDAIRTEFLVAGRFIPYKRVDLAIAAANQAKVPLVVAGAGPEGTRLRAMAGPTVRFVDSPSDDEMRTLLQRAVALVHPGVEDFGMLVVEAQACGTPVIARAAGGALDSVDPDRSGVLVSSDRVDDWAAALAEFADPADSEARRRFALQFGRDSFVDQINRVVGTS
ncbi:MAG: glycosyltransferase involved in cell wall biosynthesis [Minisyncoccia bacterium]